MLFVLMLKVITNWSLEYILSSKASLLYCGSQSHSNDRTFDKWKHRTSQSMANT